MDVNTIEDTGRLGDALVPDSNKTEFSLSRSKTAKASRISSIIACHFDNW